MLPVDTNRTYTPTPLPSSDLSLPPWDSGFLQMRCGMINGQIGRRESDYQALLDLILTAIQATTSLEDSKILFANLMLITSVMPSEIKERVNIDATLDSINGGLVRSLCRKINDKVDGTRTIEYTELLNALLEAVQHPLTTKDYERLNSALILIYGRMPKEIKVKQPIIKCVEDVKSGLYASYVPLIRDMLCETRDSSEVLKLQTRLEIISKCPHQKMTINPNLNKSIEACNSFANKKFSILSFIHHRQNITNPPAPQDLSTSTGPGRGSPRCIYPVLSIDGGGIRGIIPATVLVGIERIARKPISQLFELVGGTSTGGILALGLTAPRQDGSGLPQYTAQDALNLYTQEHSRIFRTNPNHQPYNPQLKWNDRINNAILNPKYLPPDLIFNEKFGGSLLSSALTDVVITANTAEAILSKAGSIALNGITAFGSFLWGALGNAPTSILSHDGLPKMVHLFTKSGLKWCSYSLGQIPKRHENYRRYSFLSRDSAILKFYSMNQEDTLNYYTRDIAAVTSAAPTYFPPVRNNNTLLMDGGVLQNSPAIPCIFEALEKGHSMESLFMVSLGTGVESGYPQENDPTAFLTSSWFKMTQPDWEEGQALIDMIGGGYHHIQHRFREKAPDLDDNRPETIALLQNQGNELVEENGDYLREICKILSPETF